MLELTVFRHDGTVKVKRTYSDKDRNRCDKAALYFMSLPDVLKCTVVPVGPRKPKPQKTIWALA